MKKLLLLFTAIGMATLSGCSNDDDIAPSPVDNDTISEVFQLTIDFQSDQNGFYSYLYPLDPPLYSADMILVYIRTGFTDQGNPIWQLVPQTYYYNGQAFSYNYDFDLYNLNFYMDSDFNLATTPQYTQDQVFRVVIIPGYDNTGFKFDTSDYNAVAKRFNIKESDIRIINK